MKPPSNCFFDGVRKATRSGILFTTAAVAAGLLLLGQAKGAQAAPTALSGSVPPPAGPMVVTGSATAICSYDDSTNTLHWSGAGAGWQRDNLDWYLEVIDPFTGTAITALDHLKALA